MQIAGEKACDSCGAPHPRFHGRRDTTAPRCVYCEECSKRRGNIAHGEAAASIWMLHAAVEGCRRAGLTDSEIREAIGLSMREENPERVEIGTIGLDLEQSTRSRRFFVPADVTEEVAA